MSILVRPDDAAHSSYTTVGIKTAHSSSPPVPHSPSPSALTTGVGVAEAVSTSTFYSFLWGCERKERKLSLSPRIKIAHDVHTFGGELMVGVLIAWIFRLAYSTSARKERSGPSYGRGGTAGSTLPKKSIVGRPLTLYCADCEGERRRDTKHGLEWTTKVVVKEEVPTNELSWVASTFPKRTYPRWRWWWWWWWVSW